MYKFNLQLFNEGAAGGEGAGAAQATTNASNGVSTQQQQVVYGKQVENVEVDNPQPQDTTPGEEGEAEGEQPNSVLPFKDLLNQNPQYKQEVEALIQNRIKNANSQKASLEKQLGNYNDLMAILYSRYGVKDGDFTGLQNALSKDVSYLQEEADLRGIDVQQLQYIKELEAQNMRIQRQQQMSQEQQYIQMQQQKWNRESEECKAKYPHFDFMYEVNNNPQFEQLIRSGVPVPHAYEVAHMNEILEAQQQATAKAVEQQVTNNVKSRQSRPQENAAKISTPGVIAKYNPADLTSKDLAEIRKRVARGEQISF